MGRLHSALRRFPGSPLSVALRFQADPAGAQVRVLRSLLQRARDTEWGRRYDFAGILRSPDLVRAYQASVPVHSFDAFRTDVERIRDGAQDVLWPGAFRYFAVSSGTTSSGRIVPVSDDMLACNRRFSLGVGLEYAARSGRWSALAGKQLTLPSWIEVDRNPENRVGQISAILSETAPWIARTVYRAVPDEMAHIPGWQDKMRAIARHVVDQDIRLIVFAPSWGRTLFGEVLKAYAERRGREATTIGEIWPNLKVIITGAVALSSYRDMLHHMVGLPDLDFVETYGASEGFISFQTDLSDPAMLIHLDNGIFFEFIRQDEFHRADARRYTITDVEPDVRYALVMTTNSGLWSYPVGDVVRFTQLDPPKILVAGRTAEMLDKYGEAVFGDEADEALQEACRQTGASVLHYHVTHIPTPSDEVMPAHQWLVEFDSAPSDMQRFADVIDQRLKEIGHHYFDRRECLAFDRPQIVSLPRGAFHRWLDSTGRRVTMQTKVPRMMEERSVADAVLDVAGH